MKRTTLKDIALKAGVSIATVSYVLNYSDKQTISNETRLKIFQIARELNYVPNTQAKSLALSKMQKRVAGFIYKKCQQESLIENLFIAGLFEKIQSELMNIGIDLFPLPVFDFLEDVDLIKERALDFLLVVDFDGKQLHRFTENFYIPIVFIEGEINDWLFRSVSVDYKEVINIFKREADLEQPLVLVTPEMSLCLKREIETHFLPEWIVYSDHLDEIKEIITANKNSAILVYNEIQALQLETFVPSEIIYALVRNEKQSIVSKKVNRILVDNQKIADFVKRCINDFILLDDAKHELENLVIVPEVT